MSDLYLGKLIEGTRLDGRYVHRLADLVTHTFICGASGSGKTVMGKVIVEEAALRGVPAIVIDLKGDLSSLALGFPEISPRMLAPWIHTDESQTLGRVSLSEANTLRARLLEWELTEAFVRDFSEHVAVEIFTPRSDRGRRLALPLIPSPPAAIKKLFDSEPDVALAMVSGLAESLVRRVIPTGNRDREQEYMTALIEHVWRQGTDLKGVEGIHCLVELIMNPPFERIGALAVVEHLPDNRRQKLAQAVNGQLVGAESGWLRGEELKIDKLIGVNRSDRRTQISVISLCGVPDFEDQSFVVAQIAFAVNAWMRQQGSAPSGDRPRLLFFLDEIGGGGGKTAFYPTFPYSSTAKPALNLLVKQGRAFGVGCVFATQNPGDIDYKGLSNCSTWIIGKLQTKRDRDKIREGLADAEFKPSDLARRLAAPIAGQFMVMTRDGTVAFVQERWLLTFHCTLSPEQILRLKEHGLEPFEGQLDTSIAVGKVPEEEENAAYLWREVCEALGVACRHLEALVTNDRGDARAKVFLEVLKDPEAVYRRLQAAIQRAAELEIKETGKEHRLRTGILELLSTPQSPQTHDARLTQPPRPDTGVKAPLGDSQIVADDGTVKFKGKTYLLYRRYAGKAVTVVEDGALLRFSVEGKVLSKTYPRD
jgi:hypothetical protein